jgi:hypothetical protein
MAFTRFSNDEVVLNKKLEESRFPGMYHLNCPGNGLNNPYIDDVHVRLQKWGSNLCRDTTNIDSNLKNLNTKLSKSNKNNNFNIIQNNYPTRSFLIDDTRHSLPIHLFRELEKQRENYPQRNSDKFNENNFPTNLDSRKLQRDIYNKIKK